MRTDDEDVALLGAAIDLVKARKAVADRLGRAAREAIDASAVASRDLTEAIRVSRDLLEALSGSAGVSKPVPVAHARSEAHRLLGLGQGELAVPPPE